MRAEQRRSRIVDLARSNGIVRVSSLAAYLDASTVTIRRDLAALAEAGLIEKFHGGGVPRDATPTTGLLGPSEPHDTRVATEAHAVSATHVSPSTLRVGIVVPGGYYYFPTIVAGIQRVLDAKTIRRTLAVSSYDPEQDRVLIRQLLEAGSTGLILAPNVELGTQNVEEVGWLFDLSVPVVLIERTVSSPDNTAALCSVRTDHELGAERAVQYLARLGHQGVALLTQGSSQTKSRVINGWRRAAEQLNQAHSPLITTTHGARQLWPTSEAGDAVLDQIRSAQVTAVLVHSDQTALALVHYAQGRGWRLPEDLSVIAYDNEIAQLADPPLTAVSPPKQWLGQTAAEQFLRMVTDGHTHPTRHITAEPDLVHRKSTAPPRTTPPPEP